MFVAPPPNSDEPPPNKDMAIKCSECFFPGRSGMDESWAEGYQREFLSPTPASCTETKGYQHIPAAQTVTEKQE